MRKPRIDLLILIIIAAGLGFLLFGGLHNHEKEREFSMRTVCMIQLRLIRDAKARWADQNQKSTNDTPTWSDLVGGKLVDEELHCLKEGTYSIGRVGELPCCSISGH